MRHSGTLPFELKVLGSGSIVPSAERYPSAYFVRPTVSEGGWLVDVGPGALQRLAEAGESFRTLRHIFISHTHFDHISGLPVLFQALNFTPGFGRTRPLTIYGHQTVGDYIDLHFEFAPVVRPAFPFEFVPLDDGSEIEGESWHLTCRAMQHFGPTLGFRFTVDGCVLAYGADTGPCPEVVELGRDADLLILEASFRQGDGRGHLTLRQAGEVARAAGAKRLLLTHFYPDAASMSDGEREAAVRASGYEGEVLSARDLLALDVSHSN